MSTPETGVPASTRITSVAPVAVGPDVVDPGDEQRLRPGVAEVRLAPAAEREGLDVVGADVVQELRRVRAGEEELGRARRVEERGGRGRGDVTGGRHDYLKSTT